MKLYVGNLPWSVDDKKLKELFSSYGEVEDSIVIKNKFSGRSKGFGFVTFANEADAKKALDEMNEKDVEGRPLTVNEAKPMESKENFSKNRDSDSNESREAPMANPSEINEDSIEETTPEIVDDNSDAEEGEEDIETVEEAVEDSEDDKPAAKEAVEDSEDNEPEAEESVVDEKTTESDDDEDYDLFDDDDNVENDDEVKEEDELDFDED